MLNVVNGTLSLSDLSEAMRLGKLGEQVVLKSKKAFEALTFIEGVKAPHDEYLPSIRRTGWVLAYYQWLSRRSFAYIQRKGLGVNEVVAMYHPLHEADLSKFADVANDITRNYFQNVE